MDATAHANIMRVVLVLVSLLLASRERSQADDRAARRSRSQRAQEYTQ